MEDPLTYVVDFRYVVDGTEYLDKYKHGSEPEVWQELIILYNPDKPAQNNLSGPKLAESTGRVAGWVLGVVIMTIFLYLAFHYDWPLGD